MAQHADAEFAQKRLRQRAHRDARRRLARAGALQNIARVVKIVLDRAGQIGVPGPGPRDRLLLVLGALDVLHRQRFGPVLPILVFEQDRDRRADGLRMPHAADDVRAVGLDLHAAAAAEALLAPPQLAIDGLERDRELRAGKPVSVATRHSPCDSPAVSNRSMRRESFMVARQSATSVAR